jgi:hyperosmotically inducible protein
MLMKRAILAAAAAGALGVAGLGCGHPSAATATSPPVAQAQPVETSKASFADAFHAVEKGEVSSARSGDYVVQRGADGNIEVINLARSSSATQKVQDSWITTKLLSAYSFEPGFKVSRIHIDTNNGVVTLAGTLDSQEDARRAVNRALGIKGVRAVKSQLAYPTARPPSETYVPSESAPPQN